MHSAHRAESIASQRTAGESIFSQFSIDLRDEPIFSQAGRILISSQINFLAQLKFNLGPPETPSAEDSMDLPALVLLGRGFVLKSKFRKES